MKAEAQSFRINKSSEAYGFKDGTATLNKTSPYQALKKLCCTKIAAKQQ